MPRKRLVYNKWSGISNDNNIGQLGSVYSAEGVDFFSDSKYFKLAKGMSYYDLINTRSNGKILASIYKTNSNYIELSADGYISGITANELNSGYVLAGTYGLGRNMGTITLSGAYERGFFFTDTNFCYWTIDSNLAELGTYSSSGTGINTDSEFNTTAGWTIGANWSIGSGVASHTAGSTAVLSRSMSPTATTVYRVATKATVTAGTCVVKIAGTTIHTLSTSTNSTIPIGIYTAAGATETLEFVPSSDFVGSIDFCRIQQFNISKITKAFSTYTPFVTYGNFIYVGNGNKVARIDMTSATPVIEDILTIDGDYFVVGITRVSDQIFVYASNGASGRQYIWDGVETSAERIITWVDKPILNVANFANIDYVVIGTTKRQQLCIVDGYKLVPVVVTDDFINNTARIYFDADETNSVETIGNKLLIGGNMGIYAFGNKTPGFTKGLIKEFIHRGGSITNMFYSEGLGYFLVAYFRGTINDGTTTGTLGTYKVNYYLGETESDRTYLGLRYGGTGFIELNPHFGDTYSNEKKLIKFTLGYKLETSTQIRVYEKSTYFANLYLKHSSPGIVAGDTYTFNSRTFTVIEVVSGNDGNLIYCSYTGNPLYDVTVGTFTRTAGTGLSSVYIDRIIHGYKLLYTITDTAKTRYTNALTGTYNEKQFALELITTNINNTPKVYDFNLYFDEDTND